MFASHDGVQWQAIEKAWQRNEKAQTRASTNGKTPKVVGGSTITQQLAKNLFLSGERNFLRKGQELLITLALESCLSKQRILEIYLNHILRQSAKQNRLLLRMKLEVQDSFQFYEFFPTAIAEENLERTNLELY